MKSVLVTGAAGFIGSVLCADLVAKGYSVKGLVRALPEKRIDGVEYQIVDIERDYDGSSLCAGADVVIHLAGKAHGRGSSTEQTLDHFIASNCVATINLAKAAANAGVSRFVFLSSIGVNGSRTLGTPFNELSAPAPHAPYAVSKYQAETELVSLVEESSMELVRIRPPLVYGANAPGNFARLLRLVRGGYPLPLQRVKNQRSLVSLGNLVSFVALCVEHPQAANELFLLADGSDVSTKDLVLALSEGMGTRSRLFPAPLPLMQLGAKMLGKEALYTQLFCDLQVDSSKARDLLGWVPPESCLSQLRTVGSAYVGFKR